MSDMKEKFIDEGIKAFRSGELPMAGNPYKSGSRAHIWWACGWEVGYIGAKVDEDNNGSV